MVGSAAIKFSSTLSPSGTFTDTNNLYLLAFQTSVLERTVALFNCGMLLISSMKVFSASSAKADFTAGMKPNVPIFSSSSLRFSSSFTLLNASNSTSFGWRSS